MDRQSIWFHADTFPSRNSIRSRPALAFVGNQILGDPEIRIFPRSGAPMARQDDGCEAPADYSDRELPPLIVILAHDAIVINFMFGTLITRSRRCSMPIKEPFEYSALPLTASFRVYVLEWRDAGPQDSAQSPLSVF